MTLAQLKQKLAELPKSFDARTIEVAIGEAADGKRLVINNVTEDDNCGAVDGSGDFGIIVIEANHAPEVQV